MPLQYRFNCRKAAQAASLLLRLAGGSLNYMVLAKLLYLADRAALLEQEAPITGDRFISLPHGMALEQILDLIWHGPLEPEDEPWFDTVSAPRGYEVQTLADAGDGELSNAEESILRTVWAEFGTKGWKELARFTHRLPEWLDPKEETLLITPESILEAAGRTREDLVHLQLRQEMLRRLDRETAAHADLPLAREMV